MCDVGIDMVSWPSHPETIGGERAVSLVNFGLSTEQRYASNFRRQYKFHAGLVNYILGMHILYESVCIIGYWTCWVVGEWFVCIVVYLVRQSLVFNMQMSPPLLHSLMTMDWLLLKLFNAVFSCNVSIL